MRFIRITAHFNTKENAKKAHRLALSNLSTRYFTNLHLRTINKKMSIEDSWEMYGSTDKKKVDARLQKNRANVLSFLDKCEGLSYTVLVSR